MKQNIMIISLMLFHMGEGVLCQFPDACHKDITCSTACEMDKHFGDQCHSCNLHHGDWCRCFCAYQITLFREAVGKTVII